MWLGWHASRVAEVMQHSFRVYNTAHSVKAPLEVCKVDTEIHEHSRLLTQQIQEIASAGLREPKMNTFTWEKSNV